MGVDYLFIFPPLLAQYHLWLRRFAYLAAGPITKRGGANPHFAARLYARQYTFLIK